MSQRNSEYERKARDLYETPAWPTELLLPHLPACDAILEPAAGSGQMVEVLRRHAKVIAFDIDAHKGLNGVGDFLKRTSADGCTGIVTNPPYELAQAFCEHALRLMEPVGGFVAMLLRTDFDHAKSRAHLFRDCPAFARKIVLMKRIVWFVEDDGKPSWKQEGPATLAYAA